MAKSPLLTAIALLVAGFLAGLLAAGAPARAQTRAADVQAHQIQILQQMSDSLSRMDRSLDKIANR